MNDDSIKESLPTNVVDIPDDVKPEDFPELLEKTIVSFNTGDVIEGTIVRIDRNEIMVDVGYKSEGIIPLRELTVRKSSNPNELVKEIKLQKAREILQNNSEISLKELSFEVGFNNTSYFSKVYEKRFGVKPLFYK